VWGFEWEFDGVGEEPGSELVQTMLLTNVAFCLETPIDPGLVCEHFEWSDGGKVDRRAPGLTVAQPFRDEVSRMVAVGGPAGGPTITRQGGLWVALYG
jgi:hypothetical protein